MYSEVTPYHCDLNNFCYCLKRKKSNNLVEESTYKNSKRHCETQLNSGVLKKMKISVINNNINKSEKKVKFQEVNEYIDDLPKKGNLPIEIDFFELTSNNLSGFNSKKSISKSKKSKKLKENFNLKKIDYLYETNSSITDKINFNNELEETSKGRVNMRSQDIFSTFLNLLRFV